MLDYVRVFENTLCFLAAFQDERLRKRLYSMMEVFKFANSEALREVIVSGEVPCSLYCDLNEYICDTEPDDFFIQGYLFADNPVFTEKDLLRRVFGVGQEN